MVRNLSDYYEPTPTSIFGLEAVKLADIVPATVTITSIARVPFGEETSHAFATNDGKEFLSGAKMLGEIAEALIASDNCEASENQPERLGSVAFTLIEPVRFRIEKETTAGGRSFYRVSDA